MRTWNQPLRLCSIPLSTPRYNHHYTGLNLAVITIVLLVHLTAQCQTKTADKHWYISLPLRFTQLQAHNTMLSGIKVGYGLKPPLRIYASIYHSFYLKSFKAPLPLNGFAEQPRLFINGMGLELEYCFYHLNKASFNISQFAGWGFMTYDLDNYQFKSKNVNYLSLEPGVNMEYQLKPGTALSIGFSYRSILTRQHIYYSSSIGNGHVPIKKTFPNGINVLLCLTGNF